MKKPEEIKNGLEYCINEDECDATCDACPYSDEDYKCKAMMEDALAYIQQLEADNAQQARCIENLTDKLNATHDAVPRWISVKERLPENDVPVLVSAKRKGWNGKGYSVVFTAFHTDGTTHTEDIGCAWNLEDTGLKYCEETDDYIIPEAWWEDVRYGEEFSKVYDTSVTHWMPLPEPPKEERNTDDT